MENSYPKLRPATNKDIEKIVKLISEALKEYNLPLYLETMDSDLCDIDSNYHFCGGIFDVLENNGGEIIGCVGIRPVDKFACELRRMYLHSSFRGKGLGKYLLNHVISEAKKLGFSRIILETASVLKEAISLYRKFGFKLYKTNHLSKCCDEAYFLLLADA
jgi:putative acetyltransferase